MTFRIPPVGVPPLVRAVLRGIELFQCTLRVDDKVQRWWDYEAKDVCLTRGTGAYVYMFHAQRD